MPTWPFEFFGNNPGSGGGGGGGPTSYIQSIQPFSISIGSGATSNTATISSVNTSLSVIFYGGFTTAATSTTWQLYEPLLTLTNSTTVTANINTSGNACTVYGTVVQFTSAAISSIQAGTISLSSAQTSNTATISSVSTSNSAVFYLGATVSGSNTTVQTCSPALQLTNATTVTALRNSSGEAMTVGYAVVNFAGGVVNSVQPEATTLTTNHTSDTQSISSVNTNNAIILWNGLTAGINTYEHFFYNLQLTGATAVTLTRTGTSTTTRTIYYTVLEFVGGVTTSTDGVQRGTIAMTNVTSNDATISSVNTSKSVCSFTGFSSSLATNNPAEAFSAVKLNSATDAHSVMNTAASGVMATIGYEVIQFN